MKRYLYMTLLGLAILVGVTARLAYGESMWKSNTFQSPTGNIICHYDPNDGAIVTCATRDTHRVAYVTAGGAASYIPAELGSIKNEYGPILQYGRTWETYDASFECKSTITSMRCVNGSGQGFWISRAGVKIVGRHDLPGLG